MDVVDFSRYAGGLLITLALMFVVLLAAKRFMGLAQRQAGLAAGDRLAIVETLILDPKRRLAVVRWGEVEHLLIVGHPGEARPIASRPAKPSFAAALEQSRGEASDETNPAAPPAGVIASRLETILARTPNLSPSAPRTALSADEIDVLLNPTIEGAAR